MKTVMIMTICALGWLTYQSGVLEHMRQAYENRGNAKACTRELLLMEAKRQQMQLRVLSGCNVNLFEGVFEPARPLDLKTEVERITAGCASKDERIRAVYWWITRNIAYDTEYRIYSADACWLQRKGVCNAYSELLVKMLAAAEVNALKVSGEAKQEPVNERGSSHAWVMVEKGDGSFMLCDPTWDAGYVTADTGKFIQKPGWEWYDVDPRKMIYTHFPDTWHCQLLERPLNRKQYESLPALSPEQISEPYPYAPTTPNKKDTLNKQITKKGERA